jgi:4-hydroxy-tetrahydrodipicolinate synthase
MGVAAVAIVAPFFYKLSPEAIYQYFKEIADAARVPVTLYNIPLFASPIDVQTVTRLAMDCPRIVGIKDSSGDLPNMMRMMAAIRPHRPDFCFLTGWEAALAPMLIAGCDGGTNATSGIVPELTGAIYRAVRDGKWQHAIQLQYQLIPLFDAMISCAEFPEGFRRGVKVRGWDMGRSRQPLSPSQMQAAEAAQQIIAKQLSGMPQVDLHGIALSRDQVVALSQDAALIDRIVQQIMQELKK